MSLALALFLFAVLFPTWLVLSLAFGLLVGQVIDRRDKQVPTDINLSSVKSGKNWDESTNDTSTLTTTTIQNNQKELTNVR